MDYVVIKLIQPKVESAADNRLRFLVEITWSAVRMAENEIFSHHGGLLSTDPAPLGRLPAVLQMLNIANTGVTKAGLE